LNSVSSGDPHVGELKPERPFPPPRPSETHDEGDESRSVPSCDAHVGEPKPSKERRDGLSGEKNASSPSITSIRARTPKPRSNSNGAMKLGFES